MSWIHHRSRESQQLPRDPSLFSKADVMMIGISPWTRLCSVWFRNVPTAHVTVSVSGDKETLKTEPSVLQKTQSLVVMTCGSELDPMRRKLGMDRSGKSRKQLKSS